MAQQYMIGVPKILTLLVFNAAFACSEVKEVEGEVRSAPNRIEALGGTDRWLGIVPAGGSISEDIALYNSSQLAVNLGRIVPSCGCTVARIGEKDTLAPGESTALRVQIDVGSSAGSFAGHIQILSREGEVLSVLQIRYEVQADRWLYVEPPYVEMHREEATGPYAARLAVVIRSAAPIGDVQVAAGELWFDVICGEGQEVILGQMQELRLPLALNVQREEQAAEDYIIGSLHVRVDESTHRLPIRLSFPSNRPWMQQNELFLGKMDSDAQPREVVVPVRGPCENLAATADSDWLSASVEIAGKDSVVRIICRSPGSAGLSSGTVILRDASTGDMLDRVSVHVVGAEVE